MICVDGNNCQLKSLKKADDFYLPDTEFILRKAKHFCTKRTGKDAGTEMYVLHESMFKVSHHFGIEDSYILKIYSHPFDILLYLKYLFFSLLFLYFSYIFFQINNSEDLGQQTAQRLNPSCPSFRVLEWTIYQFFFVE